VQKARTMLSGDFSPAFALKHALGLAQASNVMPLQAASFATISPGETGAASTLFNTSRQLGVATGVAT
jgi:acetyl-CoA carboxylase alpha subunit